tara:strand:- start:54 stop:308 length:255 start_codon:yes stop_codon:yes gene_type:complete
LYHNFRVPIQRDDNTFFGLECELIDEDFDSFVTCRRQKQKSFDSEVKERRKQERLKKNKVLKKLPPGFSMRAYADFEHVSTTAH